MRFRHAVAILCATFGLLALACSARAAGCDPDEIKIGEDKFYNYCIKASVVDACRRKGGDVARCINAGCVHTAGETLKNRLASCNEDNSLCLADKGVAASLIATISTCIIASAASGNPNACYAGSVAGAIAYDAAVATCRIKFGRCVQPALSEHDNFVKLCRRYRG